MKYDKRRFIAFLAGKLMGNRNALSVFDHAVSEQTGFTGTVSTSGIFMLDLEKKCRIVGQGTSDHLVLSYGDERINMALSEKDKTFTGYDVASAMQFYGIVSGREVTLFDDEEEKDFKYDV
jgi:hypothetical protein